MVATGIQGDVPNKARPRNMSVVEPVAKAVGSSVGGTGLGGPNSEGVYDGHDSVVDNYDDSSLLSGGRRSGRDELPLYDADEDNQLDIPTFLRRQAD